MQTRILDTQEAPNKFWAYKDAAMRSLVNSTAYTQSERTRAERLKLGLELVYNGKFYIAFGKQGVSVKIHDARVRDNKNLALLEEQYAHEGIVKKVSAQGITYRIKKA